MQNNIIGNRRKRGFLARRYIRGILDNPEHPLYTATDVQLAKKLNVTRLTINNIRKEMGLKCRNGLIIDLIRSIDTRKYTIKELAKICMSKYQNMYKIVKNLKLQTRPDKRPIESMLEHQRKSIKIG